MKKALNYAAVIFFLFIIVSLPCSGCKKNNTAANNDNVSESAGSDIESEPSDDSALDDSALDDSALDDSALDDSALDDSALDDSALDDSALDDSALDDSALDDSALDDSALDDSALDDSALDDSALDDVVLDDLVIDDSKDSSLNKDAESNKELNEDASPVSAVDESDQNNVVVVVEGNGETLTEAKKDAMRNAVEQVVGALVDAQTRIENDELIEQILTASGAYIEKSEVLSVKKEDGIVKMKLRASVVKMSLTKKLNFAGGGQTIAIDGVNMADMANSKVDAEKSGAMFLANFLKKEEFPYSLLDSKIVNTSITHKGGKVIYTLTVEATVNRERYMDFAKRVKPIFDKYAIQQTAFTLETFTSNKEAEIMYNWGKTPGIKYTGDYLPFYLCTGVTGNFRSLNFSMYELPQKFKIPLEYYSRVLPAADVSMLDSNNNVIANNRAILCFGAYEKNQLFVFPLNLTPYMFGLHQFIKMGNSLHGIESKDHKIESIKESTLFKRFRIAGKPWLAFAPYYSYGFDSKSNILPSYTFDISIVLTPDELSKVRSAKVTVVVNNPAMDKAFERMESEIEQIPTD